MNPLHKYSTLFLILLFLCFGVAYSQDKEIVLAASTSYEGTIRERWVTLLYTDLFARLGYCFKMEFYPSKRGAVEANSGREDGLVERVYEFNEKYTDLVRVECPVTTIKWLAISNDSTLEISSWESLRDTPLKVEYRIGLRQSHVMLKELVPEENLSSVATAVQGVGKASLGRTDVYIDLDFILDELIVLDKFTNKKIHVVGIVDTDSNYMFLHKKHARLAPLIAIELEQMKEEGKIEEYQTIAKEERVVQNQDSL